MSKKLGAGDAVWKIAAQGGYEGPGHVVVVFKNWMGQPRYVVSHKIAGGRGYLYHIYAAAQLERQLTEGAVEEAEEKIDAKEDD